MTQTMHFLSLTPSWPTSAADDGGGGGAGGGGSDAGAGGASTIEGGGGADSLGGGAADFDYATLDYDKLVATLPDDLKGSGIVTKHKSVTDLVNAAVAAEKRLGVPADQLLRVPTKPDDTEALGAIYKALGAPESAEGYKIAWDDASDADKATIADFSKTMFEKGPFPPAFMQAATDWWRGQVAAAEAADTAANTAASEAAVATLKTEFGAKYDDTAKEVGKLAMDLGGQALADELDATGLGNHPELFRAMAKMAGKLAEGTGGGNEKPDVGKSKMTPSEAYAARSALEGDPVKRAALEDRSHAMHAAVFEERKRLLAFENPHVDARATQGA